VLSFVQCLIEVLCDSAENGIRIVERLFSSNLVVTVCSSLPTVLCIHHFRKGTEICRHKYEHAIQAVRLNPLVCFWFESYRFCCS